MANKELVATSSELLDLCLIGSRTPKRDAQDAADSIRSLLALNLKHNTVIVTADMVPHYRVLQRIAKRQTKK